MSTASAQLDTQPIPLRQEQEQPNSVNLLKKDTIQRAPPAFEKRSIEALPYIMDDFMFIGGLNQSILAYSIAHRDIKYRGGFQVGFEVYTPISNKSFLHGGLMLAQRGFELRLNKFYTYRLEIPVIVAYELPEFRKIDFRFILGAQFATQVAHEQILDSSDVLNDRYFSDQFKPLDIGFTAGLSAEYRDIFLRFRGTIGANNLVKYDSATIASFQFEIGYFLFRKFRSIPSFQVE